jgi:hypothetical protein
MTDDEFFAERQRKRIVDHWRASRRRTSGAPGGVAGAIDDEALARLQHEASSRAASNWDEDEQRDFEGEARPIGSAIADSLDASLDTGPNKTPFLGPAYLAEYLRSPHWLALRERMLKRAGGFCQRCRERRHPLEVHHLTYRNVGQERESELKVLCHECHELEHGHGF